MTISEETLKILGELKSIKEQIGSLDDEIEEAKEEEEPVYDEKVDFADEQNEKSKDVVSRYCLTSKVNDKGTYLSADLYGIDLFHIVYSSDMESVSYSLTSNAKKFVDWDTEELTKRIEEYVSLHLPSLKEQLATLYMEKNKCEYKLASLYAQYALTPWVKWATRNSLKKEIKAIRAEMMDVSKIMDPLEKRIDKITDVKMKEVLADIYQVQEAIRECLSYDEEYMAVFRNWQTQVSKTRSLQLKKEKLLHAYGYGMTTLTSNSEMILELVNITKKHKGDYRMRLIANEALREAANREESLRRFAGYGRD